MRFKKTIPLLLIVLLLTSFCACTQAGNKSIPVDMMKSVPDNTNLLAYWNISSLGTDEALEDIYNKFKDSEEVVQLHDIGVNRSDIEKSGRASGFGQATVTIFTGKLLDSDAIKSELDKRDDYEPDDYQSVSIWTPDDTEAKSIAVISSIVLMGDRDDIIKCVDVIALEQELSLDNDRDITSLMDRLPDGFLVYINKAGSDPEEVYPELVVYGKSYAKQGNKELKLTAVYMFDNYYNAGDAQEAIIDYLNDNGFREPEVESFDDIYLRATAVIDTTDFADVLYW